MDTVKWIEILQGQEADIRKALADIKDQLSKAFEKLAEERFGLKIGGLVISEGKVAKVVRLYNPTMFGFEKGGRPWLFVNYRKKDGTFQDRMVTLLRPWELYQDESPTPEKETPMK